MSVYAPLAPPDPPTMMYTNRPVGCNDTEEEGEHTPAAPLSFAAAHLKFAHVDGHDDPTNSMLSKAVPVVGGVHVSMVRFPSSCTFSPRSSWYTWKLDSGVFHSPVPPGEDPGGYAVQDPLMGAAHALVERSALYTPRGEFALFQYSRDVKGTLAAHQGEGELQRACKYTGER